MKILTLLPVAACAVLIATSPVSAKGGGMKLMTSLTGAAEVPGPGDADGSGTAMVRINPGQTQICYTLKVKALDPATMAHIHKGAAGVAGPVVVPLKAPAMGSSAACATVTRELAKAIMATPGDYYVNVHTAAFPAGAVRGQLGR